MTTLLYRALYDALRAQDTRNYASDHNFDEWLDWYLTCGTTPHDNQHDNCPPRACDHEVLP